MKFKTKIKDCQLLVKVKTATSETVDEKELDRFSRIYPRGFLRPTLRKKNFIEYSGPVSISLYDRLKRPITKREFLFILEQIVVAVQKLQTNNLAINNMLMNPKNVYINEVTKEMQFIYIPLTEGVRGLNLVQFIETVSYSAKPADEKDCDYVSRFIYYFRAIQPFNIMAVETFVAKEDRSVVNIIRKQNAGQSGFMTNKPKQYYDHYDKEKESDDEATALIGDDAVGLKVEDDEPTGLLVAEDDEATGILADDEATGILNVPNDEATGLLTDYDRDEATGLLIDNNANIRFPTLFRVLTEETISINKPVFRLGKEKSYVDYFVNNNVAVSRSHADIITRGNKCFVKDLNSKNRTYINNQEISVHMEVEIHDGDRLKLGNEEFIFNV